MIKEIKVLTPDNLNIDTGGLEYFEGQYQVAKTDSITDDNGNKIATAKAVSDLNKKIDTISDSIIKSLIKDEPNLSNVMLPRIKTQYERNFYGRKLYSLLGDSISHGAFAQNLYWNGYTQILRRMLNIETDSTNWGFVSILPDLSKGGEKYSKDIHEVSKTGTWESLYQETASHTMNGMAYKSITSGSKLIIKVPLITKYFRVSYTLAPNYGSFSIKVNGVQKYTQECSRDNVQKLGNYWSSRWELEDRDGDGYCYIELETLSNDPVEIQGIFYINSEHGLIFNNFSQSGRRLRYIDKNVLETAIRGHITHFLALGHNDSYDAHNNPEYAKEFSKRIDWIIEFATKYQTKIYILDFIWTLPKDNYVRLEFQRMISLIPNASLISFPNFFNISGKPVTTSYLIDDLKLFSDSSHPNINGHKLIAEMIAKTMNLSCNSKEVANRNDTMWTPLPLDSSAQVKNYFKQFKYTFAYRVNGGNLQLKGYFKTVNGEVPSVGSLKITSDIPNIYVPMQIEYPLNSTPTLISNGSGGTQTIQLNNLYLLCKEGAGEIYFTVKDVVKSKYMNFNINIPITI